jgi:hypothetical protein
MTMNSFSSRFFQNIASPLVALSTSLPKIGH